MAFPPVCNVYEGFIDYLSAQELGIGIGEDHIILNSVANIGRAIPVLHEYAEIRCWLNNDNAGRKTFEALIERLGESVHDRSGLFEGHKDLNEYLTSKINKVIN